jgi:hypothetical protein
VRFAELLKTTVMLSAGAATTLATITVVAAGSDAETTVVFVVAGWWLIAAVVGIVVGRSGRVSPAIGRLLASARPATTLPEIRPGSVVFNRLWPLAGCTVAAGALAFLAPQIPGIATGFAIIWALAWRGQDRAVTAIEERDGVTFYIQPTSPVQPIQLVRIPGFRRDIPRVNGVPHT